MPLEEDLINQKKWRYLYDDAGRLLQKSEESGIRYICSYDSYGELSSINLYMPGESIPYALSYTYAGYEQSGTRLLTQLNSNYAGIHYSYDDFYRASKTVTGSGGTTSVKTEYTFREGSAADSTGLDE